MTNVCIAASFVLKLPLITFNRKYMKFFKHPRGVELGYWLLKKLIIMKLIITLILALSLNTFAKTFSQTKITLSVKSIELKKVLLLIEKQSIYHFLFSDRKFQTDKKVDVDAIDEDVLIVLNRILANSGFTYYELSNHLIVITREGERTDKIKVTGKIVSEKGEPLAGASVRIKGTNIGTTTDADGIFNINVDDSAVLEISFLGYQSTELSVNGKTSFNITLQSTTASLNEVVVVGYGKQKKIDLTGSVSAVDGDKDLSWKPVGQVSEALHGVVPGLTVTQASGQPGNDFGTIRVRGIGTFNENDPLVLVDGVQYNINDVDANDIASLSVLKDAAAASIYGIRAANGVILITTKRGASAGKTKIAYSNYFGWQKPARLSKFVGAQEYMKLSNELYENSGSGAPFSDSVVAQYNNPNRDLDLYPDNYWLKKVLTGSGFQQQHSISLAGGSENIRYRFSTNYFDQKGLVENMNFQRLTVRLNTDINVTKKLNFSADLSARISDRKEPQDNGAGSAQYQFLQSTVMNPTIVDRYSDGTWGIGRGDGNPIRMQQEGGIFDYKDNLITGNFRANYELIKGLTLSGIASVNYDAIYNSKHDKALDYYNFFITPHPLLVTKGQNDIWKEYTGSWFRNFQGLAEYNKEIGDHSFKLLGGASNLSTRYDDLTGYRKSLPNGELEQINPGSADGQTTSGTANEYDLISYFGRFNYSYKDKYLFEANIRRDGSSRFPEGQKWGTFPSFSAGWRISSEEFMRKINFFQDLKVRGSWGKLGNDNTIDKNGTIIYYPYQSTYSFNNSYPFGGSLNTAVSLTAYPSSSLTWETTTMTDFGIDMTILAHKLDVSFDYYIKNTDDILFLLPIPETVGLPPSQQNALSMQNKGWELALNYHGKAGRDFKYNIGVNLSDVTNKVTDMKGADFISTDNNNLTSAYKVGLPIGAFYGYQAQGIFKTQADVDAHATQPGGTGPGDLIYMDQDKDNAIGPKDRVYLGNSIPRYTYGINLGASYKGFDLGALLQGVGKADINTMSLKKAPVNTDGNFKTIHAAAWTPDDPNATFPRLVRSQQNYVTSSYWIESGAYLRLKSIQLGYTLPVAWTKKAGLSRLRIYVSGQNLLTFSKLESDIDPEAPLTNRYYPQVKTYTFGLNVEL